MRTLIVALAIALVSVSAYAQEGIGGVPKGLREKATPQADVQKKRRAEAEKAYKKALDTIPEANKPYDPWQSVRP